jgi:hypothetical protein
MDRQKGGAIAVAGAVAVSGHVAAYGHLFPLLTKDARPAARTHFEMPEVPHKPLEEIFKHCTQEADQGKSCTDLP